MIAGCRKGPPVQVEMLHIHGCGRASG
jgi:hypothetical protein